jgi:hypothetical protein
MTIYARHQLVEMDDDVWAITDKWQHEQLQREVERCEQANRERYRAANPLPPGWRARAIARRLERSKTGYLTTAFLGHRDD